MTNAALRPSFAAVANQSILGLNPRLFVSPPAAGRKITAGFSFIHRITKTSSVDVWFPEALQRELDAVLDNGGTLGPENFPAQWAAVRQFDLLQEAGNYKIYDMDVTYITRSLMEFTRSMRAGGYSITVATLGSYEENTAHDELEILDKRLQDRISKLIHMLYLDEQSEALNQDIDRTLREGRWDIATALPQVGATLGAKDLFRPARAGQPLSDRDRRHKLSRHFFDILGLLPNNHIVHDTAVGLQLPEANSENEWHYAATPDKTVAALNTFLGDLFGAQTHHMRGYGDRLSPQSSAFYGSLARLTLGQA